jgi:hypothetical protein
MESSRQASVRSLNGEESYAIGGERAAWQESGENSCSGGLDSSTIPLKAGWGREMKKTIESAMLER